MGTKVVICLAALLAISGLVWGGRGRGSGGRRSGEKHLSGRREQKTAQVHVDSPMRKGKFFSLFNVVTFTNGPCASTENLPSGNGNRNGTCFTVTECSDRGGTSQGNCAAGFGVCCVFVVDTADAQVTQNCSYIQNPGFPSATTASAGLTFTINLCSPDVCSLRLDFETFSIQGVGGSNQPDEGTCLDSFNVAGVANQVVPEICGENTGQHIYVDAADPTTVTFAFMGTATSRQWDIKVTQIECANANRPPTGCLQYHATLTGRITTFNFDANGDNHLNNQEYSICIRPEAGFCCVQYSVCSDVTDPFSLDSIQVAAMVDSLCTEDFLGISNSGVTCDQGANLAVSSRYCGLVLNQLVGGTENVAICDCTAPFIVDVVTNGLADGAIAAGDPNANANQASRGVCLDYMQVPCAST